MYKAVNTKTDHQLRKKQRMRARGEVAGNKNHEFDTCSKHVELTMTQIISKSHLCVRACLRAFREGFGFGRYYCISVGKWIIEIRGVFEFEMVKISEVFFNTFQSDFVIVCFRCMTPSWRYLIAKQFLSSFYPKLFLTHME